MNNKGFTLVELIVTIAILAIVAMGVLSLMSAGSRSYSNVQGQVNLQIQSQIVMGQLQEFISNCSGGITWDATTNTLHLIDTVDVWDNSSGFAIAGQDGVDDEKTLQSFVLTNNELFYEFSQHSNDADIVTATAEPIDDLMSQNIESINFTITSDADGVITLVAMDIVFEYRGAQYSATQLVTMKNSPVYATDINTLITAINSR